MNRRTVGRLLTCSYGFKGSFPKWTGYPLLFNILKFECLSHPLLCVGRKLPYGVFPAVPVASLAIARRYLEPEAAHLYEGA